MGGTQKNIYNPAVLSISVFDLFLSLLKEAVGVTGGTSKSVCSGPNLLAGETSTLYAEVEGPKLFAFFWRVSCEDVSDSLTISWGGKVKAKITGL